MFGYFGVLAVSGYIFSRRQQNTDEYFRGGGGIPAWAAAISLLATSLSAATFIGGPEQSFRGDLSYLSANIGGIIAIAIVAAFFIPVYYRLRIQTVYGLLGHRFGANAAATAGGAFIIGRVFASGARAYIAAIPASLIVFGDIELSHQLTAVAVMTVVGIAYTLVGGIRAVIWTDVIQTGVFITAAVAAIWLLLDKIPLPLPEIAHNLQNPGVGQPSKLALLKLGLGDFSPQQTYTLLSAVFGFTLLNIGAYGADQDLAQRLLTCRSALRGSWSAVGGVLLGIPVVTLFMVIGLLLYIFYSRPDLMGAAAPTYQVEGSRQIFLSFILREMPPGMSGLMMAGLFAAGLSSLNSAINAMSSSIVNDFVRRIKPRLSERHYLRAGQIGVIACGAALGLFAAVSAFYLAARPDTTLIDFALTVMLFSYSGLAAVFIAALFTRRGNEITAISAIVAGFIIILAMQKYLASTLAFPWQMFIATALAFTICVIGGNKPEGLKNKR